MQFDWHHIENLIVSSAIECIQDFARNHPDEVFYGFFLDVNADHFDLLGHFNTAAKLRETAIKYQAENARLYPDWSVERLEDRLRWSAGDWGYFEVFNPWEREEEYKQFCSDAFDYSLDQPEEETEEPTIEDQFLNFCCRVAVRLETENAFCPLNTTPDFRVLCADHDELPEESERRLQSVRNSMDGGT